MSSRTALASVGALALGAAAMLALHVLPPTDEISPVRRTLSEYALSDNKWLFDLAVLSVAFGSALGFAALVRHRGLRPYSGPVVLGALWTASLLVIVTFTKTDWTVGPSLGGTIHRWASVIGFVSLPLAVLIAAHKVFPEQPVWRWVARGFGLLSLGWFGVIIVGVIRMAAGYGPWWLFVPLGLVERAMALTAVAAIVTLVLGLVAKSGRPAEARSLASAG